MIAVGLAVMVVLAAGMLLRGASLHEGFPTSSECRSPSPPC